MKTNRKFTSTQKIPHPLQQQLSKSSGIWSLRNPFVIHHEQIGDAQNDDDCVEQSPARQSVEMHGPARALAAELAAELVAALNILVILK